jgi:hypothetical protein
MRNRKSEPKSRFNKSENISLLTSDAQAVEIAKFTEEAKQAIFDTVQDCGEELNQAFVRTFGVEAWFREYLKSAKFAELSEESKEEALNAFLGLHRFLDHIDEIHSQHHLGAYRRE